MNSIEVLKKYDLKVTPQRIAIVDSLNKKGHISIDDLYKILLKKFSTISLATVYKNINAMLGRNFIEEVKLPNQKSVYELNKSPHSHLVCSKCGYVEDININLQDTINSIDTNFKIEKSDLTLSGLCSKCL